MSGGAGGQGWPLNQLITLSPNFPSRHSLTLSAVYYVAPSCCSQKCRLVNTFRTSDQRKVCRNSSEPPCPQRSGALGPTVQNGLSPLDYWLWPACLAELRRSPPATLGELIATLEE